MQPSGKSPATGRGRQLPHAGRRTGRHFRHGSTDSRRPLRAGFCMAGSDGRDSWNEATKEKRYTEAYDALNSALKKTPATPHALSDALWIARELGRTNEEVQRLEWRLYALLTWISLLGEGSEQYPAVVVNVRDEYTFMYDYMGVRKVLGQQLIRKDDGIPLRQDRHRTAGHIRLQNLGGLVRCQLPVHHAGFPGHWAKKTHGRNTHKGHRPRKRTRRPVPGRIAGNGIATAPDSAGITDNIQ